MHIFVFISFLNNYKYTIMDKKVILSRLLLLCVVLLLMGNSMVHAQNQSFQTDTVIHQEFGCDSYLLPANHTVYYADTVIKIPHYIADQGIVYMDVLDVYQITIGHSYDYKDTVTARVCRNKLPYAYHGNFYTKPGSYWVNTPTLQGCDSLRTLVNLVVLEGQRDTTFVSMCNANPVVVNGITFPNPGTFNFPQGVDDDGCPVVQTYVITQYPEIVDTVDLLVCQNELPYPYMGYGLTNPGNYRVHYEAEGGCDAIKYVRFRVCPVYEYYDTVEVTVCETELPYEYGGEVFNAGGTYQVTVPNRCGCDSLFVTLNLQVLHPQIETDVQVVCAADFPYVYDSLHVFSKPGSYYINEDADSTCSLFTHLVLSAYQPVYDTLTICTTDSSYTFEDTVFTASTVYTYSDTNMYGCVDYHTLQVNLNTQLVYDTLVASICASEAPFVFHGVEYWYSGVYDVLLQNRQGCDSASVHLEVNMIPNPILNKNFTITRNDIPFVYYDSVFTETGNYMLQIPAASETECDTLLYMRLVVQPVYNQTVDTTVCANNVVNYLGEDITREGTYKFVYHFEDYDSIITLNVHHLPTYVDETVNVTVGEFDLPYRFADNLYYEAGYYEQVLPTVLGCDSVVSLNLTVMPAIINNDTIFRELCSNDLPLLLFDSALTEAGVYRFLTHTEEAFVDSVFYVKLDVKESPTLVIADTSYLCAGSAVTLTAQSTGSIYRWNNGELQPSITATLPGQYGVTVTNAFECSSSATVQVIPADLPEAEIVGDNQVCNGSDLLLEAVGGTEYLWSNGSVTSEVTVSPTENTTYTVTVSNVYGCSVVKDIAVTVNPLPELSLQGNNSICAGSSTTFYATGAQNYQWSNGVNADHVTVGTEGIYTVTATDLNGCQNSTSVVLTVHPLPVIKINGRNTFCQGGSTTITATGANTYEWSSGEVTQSVVASYVGSYTVTGTDQYGCSATKNVIITQSTVNASISGNLYFCHGQSTLLTITGDAGNTYHWFDGSSANTINISTPGQYSVTVTNTGGCQNTLTATVSEYNTTAPEISGNLTICGNQTTTLRASGGSSYVWDNGSTQAMINVNTTGTYSVTATNSYGCTATTSATVLVNPLPSVNILAMNTICKNDEVTLTAVAPTAGTFQWSSGQNTAVVTVSPSVSSNYTVLVTDENGCSNTTSMLITVNPLPQVIVSGQTTICQGDTAHLSATGGILYSWSNGQQGANMNATTAGTYTVTATNANGCSAEKQVSVTMNPLPVATVTEQVEICRGQQAQLVANAPSGYTYNWSTGSHQNMTFVTEPGVYRVTVTNANQCSRVYQSVVGVHELPEISVVGMTAICQGQSTTLTAMGASSYIWNTGETSSEISVSPASNTTYSVTGYDDNGCSATVQKVVNVESLPAVQVLGERTVCQGQSTVLTAIGGISYHWSNGSNSQDIVVSPNVTSTYTVTVSNASGCSAVGSATVVVNVLPSIFFSGNTTICQGQSTTIVASGGYSYLWSTGATTNSISVSDPGVYKVNVTNSLNCMRSDSVIVVVRDNPTVNVNGSSIICQGSSAVLNASGAETYLWSTGENSASIVVMPGQTTTYNVVGYDENGCSSTVSKVVNVEAPPQVYISGELTVCHGESTTLTSSNAHAYAWSTGSTANSITVSSQGVYAVTVSSENGCQSMASVTVEDRPVPVFTLSGSGYICENSTEALSVTGDNEYVWSTGETTPQIIISAGGAYSVTATNNYNCSLASSIFVIPLPAPELSIVGVPDLCQGEATTLVASAEAVQFVWNTGDSTQTIEVVPDNTVYTVTATNVSGCSSVAQHEITSLPVYNMTFTDAVCENQEYHGNGFDIPAIDTAGTYPFVRHLQTVSGCDSTVNLLLTVNPLPQLDTINGPQTITQHGNAYYTINNPQYVNSYEWMVSNTHWTIVEANYNLATLNVTTNGTGVLTARGINNCGYTETSLSLYCNVGIEDYPSNASVVLYPNPVHQSLFINLENTPEVSKVCLFDETGRLVYKSNCNDTHLEIDCTRFANGHYTVQFLNEKGRRVESRKIVVNNK